MKIEKKELWHIAANCYMISTPQARIVIDPGKQSDTVDEFFNGDGHKLILLTHCHFDHIMGAAALRELTGAKIAIGKDDEPGLRDAELSFSRRFHVKQQPFSADILLSDGDCLTVGDLSIKVISTPGHSAGGVCYLIENCLFSGDTLFNRSIGITDNDEHLQLLTRSVRKLYTLEDGITVYPGHGEITTIGDEKRLNPFVRAV